MPQRNIVQIDETKCNGCGLCVPACAEGAIQIVGGKARLVSEVYCDGLGACLGECPQGAIRVIEREAQPFDEEAARQHVSNLKRSPARRSAVSPSGCPGADVQSLVLSVLPQPSGGKTPGETQTAEGPPSALAYWPIQLHLVPPNAPFLDNADLLLVADCVPFAVADFHGRFLRRRPVVIGCPKLDDTHAYVEKLTAILRHSSIRSLTVVRMEVPCCLGLVRVARSAMQVAGRSVPLEEVTISIRGEVAGPGPNA